ncbi:type 1 glutamine amidotransferase [Epibacterium ulvae]|uniref:type 1 glutamine amidotransferase n=1 Tax=Epibacterium ulvae TaxID=1156985 RepID=UPI001BFC3992|nr:type 1 glutamine amidotransferase [Epibacterium ulvae]MBT8155193.1 type 1 glutamine amidotransferase [Epibacterium ulvae]
MLKLEAFIQKVYVAEIPIFGVCFGHQIMAKALGGKVEKYNGGWSAGPNVYESQVFGNQGIIARHQDQVVERSPEARLLGSSNFCENAILGYGDRALSMQAHPEFDSAYL